MDSKSERYKRLWPLSKKSKQSKRRSLEKSTGNPQTVRTKRKRDWKVFKRVRKNHQLKVTDY